jgi:UDP-N-acetylglucosamine--N-acetylmuramyl-(pentapeptide) pyrophosphoryl-undecaprenol N-acetylglucosamine transferase
VIVWHHEPGEPDLEQAIWRLHGPRLRGVNGGPADPLSALRQGMGQLAVRDADQRLARLLMELAAG